MSFSLRVLGGAGLIAASGALAKLVSFFTIPILTPLLGPDPYGAVALIGGLVSLGAVLGLLGIDMAYARYYLQGKAESRYAVECFCWRFAAAASIAIGLLIGAGWVLWGAPYVGHNRAVGLYSAAAIVLACAVSMVAARVRLQGDYRRIAIATLAASLVSAAVTIGLTWWRTDIWPLLIGALVASGASVAIMGAPPLSSLLRSSTLPAETKRSIIKLGIAGTAIAPMHWLISSADKWVLAEYEGTRAVGVYAVASSIALVGLMLNSGVTLAWFPEASRFYGDKGSGALSDLGRMWSRLVCTLGVCWLAVSAAGGDLLRLLTAPVFHEGARYIPALAAGVFFYGVASLANTSLLLTSRMGLAAYVWLIGAGLSLGLNFALVPMHGALGAAIAQCISFGIIAAGVMACSSRVLPLPLPGFRLGATLLFLILAGIFMQPAWHEEPIASLALKALPGLVVATIAGWIMAPEWISQGCNRVARLIKKNHQR